MDPLSELARSWLANAEILERYGDERGAEVIRRLASELEEAVRCRQLEMLTLSEAAEESGYSQDHLRHLVADGTIPNAGEKGRPRIRRADLPMKPGASSAEPAGSDANADADAILATLNGGQ